MSELDWQPIHERLAGAAVQAGLDLVQPFGVARYNAVAPPEARLPDFGRPNPLGVLVGNTRQLWPVFTRAYASDPELARSEHPLDTYVVTRLPALVRAASPARQHLIFSHVIGPSAFPIQRLAEAIGFAAISPSHLAIHPQHGPWLGLRAVVVLDVAGPETATSILERPCERCSAPCVPALQHALEASGTALDSASIAAHASDWIAVRDACPLGKASRYGSRQLAYHYAPRRSRILPDD